MRGSPGDLLALGQFQSPLQVVIDLWERASGKALEVWIAAVLDLVSEKRSIAFLIVDLAPHVITVESRACIRFE